MQQYSHDYTLPQQADQLLREAQVKIKWNNYYEAEKRISEARTILQQYLAQGNMIPDNDVADGWVRHSEAQTALEALHKQVRHYQETQKTMNALSREIVRNSEETLRENQELKAKVEKHKQIDSSYLTQQLDGADPDNPLYGKVVVLSGTFEQIHMERDQVAAAIQRLGAKLNRSVSSTMQVFVMGNKVGPAKMQQIEDLRAAGHDIHIVSQIEFKEICSKYLQE